MTYIIDKNMTHEQGKYGLKVESVSPDILKPNKWNPNSVSAENELKLEESLKRHGFFKPALVRERDDGSLEIIGGEHRVSVAQRMGYETVPIINLGKISDTKAKELTILDNGRYGQDDTLQLAELLSELGSFEDLVSFLPYSTDDLSSILSSTEIELDDLDTSAADLGAELPMDSVTPTHQMMRFKVPFDDAEKITAIIEKVMRVQGFTKDDAYSNAGNALVHLLLSKEEFDE